MGDLILIDRMRAERLRDLALSYLEYQKSVVDKAARAVTSEDLIDDLFTAPTHVCDAPVAVPAGDEVLRERLTIVIGDLQIEAYSSGLLGVLDLNPARVADAVLAALRAEGGEER